MKINSWLRAALEVSPLTVAKALLQPNMIGARLSRLGPSGLEWAARQLLPDVSSQQVCDALHDLHSNHAFYTEVNQIFVPLRHARAECGGFREFLYVIVRLTKPDVMIETGVWDGQGTAVILQAMEDNACGHLVSLDLPARQPIPYSTDDLADGTLPPECEPGWTVPNRLKGRHELILGNSAETLPAILQRFELIDIFLHDSLHTDKHMSFEFETAWPHLKTGGILVSHDIFDNPAFHRFSRRVGRKYYHALGTLGAIRK
jgi:predicted O-methyltransferase YrrM